MNGLGSGQFWADWLPWIQATFVIFMVVLGYGLGYFVLLQVLGQHSLRAVRQRAREQRAAKRRAAADGPSQGMWADDEEPAAAAQAPRCYFLVPCLNEVAVIGSTVRNLLSIDEHALVVVVDDGSDDGTGEAATAAGGERVLLVTRRAPHARQGKGRALNEGLETIRAHVAGRGIEPRNVIVCVMDADGTLTDGALREVAPLFADPATGGVQLPVRIRNRHSFLTRLQDVGFWGTAVVAQCGRDLTGSVSLGGNGQFTRLAALDSLGEKPWSDSLTEDLDLTISLAVNGWTTRTTPSAWVVQEAPTTLRALMKQRTRWAQGHMVCAARVGELYRSSDVSGPAAFELTAYLMQPWLLTLPWSLLGPVLLGLGVWAFAAIVAGAGIAAAAASLLALYVLAFAPLIYSAMIYHRRAKDVGLLESVWLLHAGLVLVVLVTLATWRAAGRIVSHKRGWDKTVHVGEPEAAGLPAKSSAGPTVAPLT